MAPTHRDSFGLYILSVVAAMILRIAPLPEFAKGFNPDWVLLVLIYWSLAVPENVGIFNAWFVGLLTDVLTYRMLGQHALGYSLAIYLCLNLHKRLRRFPLFQQALFILTVLFISQALLFWTENIKRPPRLEAAFWLPVFTGTLSWPLVYTILRKLRVPDIAS
jgi:rod shape-determining protein MreD